MGEAEAANRVSDAANHFSIWSSDNEQAISVQRANHLILRWHEVSSHVVMDETCAGVDPTRPLYASGVLVLPIVGGTAIVLYDSLLIRLIDRIPVPRADSRCRTRLRAHVPASPRAAF